MEETRKELLKYIAHNNARVFSVRSTLAMVRSLGARTKTPADGTSSNHLGIILGTTALILFFKHSRYQTLQGMNASGKEKSFHYGPTSSRECLPFAIITQPLSSLQKRSSFPLAFSGTNLYPGMEQRTSCPRGSVARSTQQSRST